MPEFINLLSPREALKSYLSHISANYDYESAKVEDALGRITADDVIGKFSMPAFPRSTVDGYAVKSKDTFGASESLPAYLKIIGEVHMGEAPTFTINPAQCVLIHTGGMIPKGADAVIMLENTQIASNDELEVLRAVAFGENVIQVGEDIHEGDIIIPHGTRLRPQEIGGLMAQGITKLNVMRRPKIGIISTGDEVIPPEKKLNPGQVYDINSYSLSALIQEAGGEAVRYGIVKDVEEELFQMASKAFEETDILLFTAGSSASTRDYTVRVIDRLGSPGVLVHGINIRPGKPTILAVCNNKLIIGLPGNPVSAFVIAQLFVKPIIMKWLGVQKPILLPSKRAKLRININSVSGREDWVTARLEKTSIGFDAIPIFGKSNLIFTLIKADGLIRIPPESNGISAGEMVEVVLI